MGLNDGTDTVDVKVIDNSEKIISKSVSFIVKTSPFGNPGMMEEILIGLLLLLLLCQLLSAFMVKKEKRINETSFSSLFFPHFLLIVDFTLAYY